MLGDQANQIKHELVRGAPIGQELTYLHLILAEFAVVQTFEPVPQLLGVFVPLCQIDVLRIAND